MNHTVKQQIKENLKNSIRNFFKDKEVKNYQVLDDIFPNERRIRSLIVDTPRSKDAGILNRIIVKTTARIISAFQVLP